MTAAALRTQLSSASREQLGVELYGVQQQLISLHERLAATEAQHSDAEESRANAELDLSAATQRHHVLAEESAAARERVRGVVRPRRAGARSQQRKEALGLTRALHAPLNPRLPRRAGGAAAGGA